MMRGNVVMRGYLKNRKSTDAAFKGGWFHTGDLGVMHPDGYIQLKDRSKDIIISGGENISSIEVEDALYKHPAVQAAAVVAKPDDKWGETPVRVRRAEARRERDGRRDHRALPRQPRGLQGAAPRGVHRSAEDEHGKDPEVQAARDGEGRLIRLSAFADPLAAFAGRRYIAGIRKIHAPHLLASSEKVLAPRVSPRMRNPSSTTRSCAGSMPGDVQDLIDRGVLARRQSTAPSRSARSSGGLPTVKR